MEMQRQCAPSWEPDRSALFFFFLISGSRFSANTGFDGNEYQIHPKQLPGSAPFSLNIRYVNGTLLCVYTNSTHWGNFFFLLKNVENM